MKRGKRRVISGELFQSELFWRVIFMQIRLFKVMKFDSLQSQVHVPTFGGCQGRRTEVGATTVSNSLILGGWVTEVSKIGDEK